MPQEINPSEAVKILNDADYANKISQFGLTNLQIEAMRLLSTNEDFTMTVEHGFSGPDFLSDPT